MEVPDWVLSLVCSTGFLLPAFLNHSAAMQRALIPALTTKTLESPDLRVPLNSHAEIKRLCIHVESSATNRAGRGSHSLPRYSLSRVWHPF